MTVETEIRGCIMLSRSLPCLWITLYIRLGCFLGSGDAQNAKEGKLVKFADQLKDQARQVRMWTASFLLMDLVFSTHYVRRLLIVSTVIGAKPVCGG